LSGAVGSGVEFETVFDAVVSVIEDDPDIGLDDVGLETVD